MCPHFLDTSYVHSYLSKVVGFSRYGSRYKRLNGRLFPSGNGDLASRGRGDLGWQIFQGGRQPKIVGKTTGSRKFGGGIDK